MASLCIIYLDRGIISIGRGSRAHGIVLGQSASTPQKIHLIPRLYRILYQVTCRDLTWKQKSHFLHSSFPLRDDASFFFLTHSLCPTSHREIQLIMSASDKALSATDKASLPFTEQHYFSSYDHFGIHEEMLKDTSRTLAYRLAMYKNRHLFKDKVVLDVGCGTGILSMFAVKAGAKHVYSVDMLNIIEKAREIVELNGFDDKITLLQGKLEDIELPVDSVDIIVSEWMGYFLLYESMLDTVLYARDKYLVEGGLILPDKCQMYVAGIEDGQYKDDKIHFWEDVYGFDYSPFIKVAMAEPLVDTVDLKSLITTPSKFFEFDINTVTKEGLTFHEAFSLEATDNDLCHAFIVWFDCVFPGDEKVTLGTGPLSQYTHWKQTVFYMDQVLDLKKGDIVEGKIASRPNARNPREVDVEINWQVKTSTKDTSREQTGRHNYFMR